MDKSVDHFVSGQKKILVTGSGVSLSSGGKQFVVTQSKGTTIIQPAAAQNTTSSSQQQYIVTAVGANANQAAGEHTSSSAYGTSAVQYVDAAGRPVNTADTVVYTTNNQPAGANVQYQYAPESYHNTASYNYASPSAAQYHSGAGEIVMGQTFFLQGGTMDGEGYPLTHTTRAAPATVKWLLENFEPCDGVSLPRSVLYNFYIHHCQTESVEPSNPASFGKLVRMIFRDLKTRRLGQRGNSRYHYYGIRLKPSSTLNQLMPDETPVAMRQPTHPQRRVVKSSALSDDGGSAPVTPKSEPMLAGGEGTSSQSQTAEDKHKQYLGTAVDAIPIDIKLVVDKHSLPEGVTQQHVASFSSLYKEHCEAILELVIDLQFSLIERQWQTFWRKPTSITPSLEARLPKDKLYALCQLSEVHKFVKSMDYAFYQSLVEVLIPDVLRPIPGSLTQAIRNFAKCLEGWLKSALVNAPDEILKVKLTALSAFSQTLRRYTSLNHLAQAARAVLVNSAQIQQMMNDLARVDFSHIQEQAAWVCQCSDSIVEEIQADFKDFLQGEHSLEDWKDWLESVLNRVLEPYDGSENYSKAARHFLLKWSFYSSMVIRDLTLRSAASFGSFHLIRLLYDEYMFYLVEHKVAAATSRTPIAVMSELIENNDQLKLANQKEAQNGGSTSRPLTAVALNTNNTGSLAGTKTVVILPHSSSGAGDGGPQAKRIKQDITDPLGVAVNSLQ